MPTPSSACRPKVVAYDFGVTSILRMAERSDRVAYDFGVKTNILRMLAERGCK